MGPYMAIHNLYGVISDHDVTSNFIVVVNSMSIFVDIIFINLRLLSPTY